MSAPNVPTPPPAQTDAARVELIIVELNAQPAPEQHARYQDTNPDEPYYDGPRR